MNDVRPFAGLRFASDPGPRVAPPYDVLSPADRERLASHPENIVHLTLPTVVNGAPDYEGAGKLLVRWRQNGVLVAERQESLYVVEEHIETGRIRRGFLALVRLADYAQRAILPHEHIMPGPVSDRLLLTRQVRANLEPLFFLYEDRVGELDSWLSKGQEPSPLVITETSDGIPVSLGALREPAAIASVRAFFRQRPLIIADGHHRYETMLRLRDECRAAGDKDPDAPHEFVMAYIVNAFDPGSRVQAIHRLLRGPAAPPESVFTKHGFALEELGRDLDAQALIARLAEATVQQCCFIVVRPGGSAALMRRRRGDALDVQVLHGELLPEIGGELSFDARPDRVLAATRQGGDVHGLLLAPTPPDALFRVVQAGVRLPQKSTYFAPKIPSGLVLRTFE